MKQLRVLLTLTGLKLRIIARRPSVLAVCLLLPILLTLLAGSTATKNDYSILEAAYVDQAENFAGSELISLLEQGTIHWTEMTQDKAERELQLGRLDGVVIIPAGYGENHGEDAAQDVYSFIYLAGDNNITTGLVRESLMVSAATVASEARQLESLRALPEAADLSLPELREMLRKDTRRARDDGANLTVNFIGATETPRGQIVEIPDFSIEVLFLSVFSLIGSLMLNETDTRRRLLSVAGGPGRDYLATLLALVLSCVVQLSLMVGITTLLMPGTTRPPGYPFYMLILLLMMLAYGQMIALIPTETRIMPASLAMLVSVVAGGAFLRLPALWIASLGQLIPHGWVMARLSGLDTYLPPVIVILISVATLIVAYYLQTSTKHLSS
ncbi:MAG: hypothetical protein ACOX3P_02720 [Saccharofermentanales bacterium]|jgi:hypothetical protein|nr:hypothetical protein [Bacillota bacterium]NLB08813.1 hypothetical protein [Clostridiales bacterium]